MRRFTHKVGTAAAVAVLAAFLQGCYTYMPTMSREADGVYYNPMKDPERDARAARYAAEQDEQYYRTNQTQQQQEYYVEEEPATPLEQAYWSTMPSSYKGDGQVK